MPYVRSFVGFRPPRRYDALAFTSALIKESATETGVYTTIETKTLSPVDADPSEPATRNFTTDDATLDPAWYKITWRDAALATFDSDPLYFEGLASDLTTVDAVRAYLQKDAGSDAQDSIVSSLVTRASLAISRHCNREFTPTTAAARKYSYSPNPKGVLDLSPYDLRTVTTLKLDTETAAPITLAATDYQLQPKTARDGVYTFLYFLRSSSAQSISGLSFPEREVEITGNWGFATVPAVVEHWCIVQVAMWLRRDVAAFEQTFSLDEDRLERPQALASAVRAGLRAYER